MIHERRYLNLGHKNKWIQHSSQYIQVENRRQFPAFTPESFCYPGISKTEDGKIQKGLDDAKLVAGGAGLMD